ncbi:MAG: hypothetical protein HY259_13490 [Chloroflexi bacterium]|nr:hypothetical protein [Chloroflexota bacterium]
MIEKIQSVTAERLVECPECHQQTLKRVIQPVGIIFKGSGWYITDSKKAGSAATGVSSANGEAKPPAEKSESAASATSTASAASEPAAPAVSTANHS